MRLQGSPSFLFGGQPPVSSSQSVFPHRKRDAHYCWHPLTVSGFLPWTWSFTSFFSSESTSSDFVILFVGLYQEYAILLVKKKKFSYYKRTGRGFPGALPCRES